LNRNIKLHIASLLFIWIITQPLFAQKVTKIQIINSNTLEYDELKGDKIRRLIGEVIFKHDSVYLYCDSAYMYANNTIDAFSNVHIEQGDSLDIYADLLKYNGNSKLAELHHNVKMTDKIMVLKTERLDYNMKSNVSYYTNGGKIKDPENDLTSIKGYYFSQSKTLFFKDSVELINENYTIYCDTLKYRTITKIAYFYGPTKIISDENTIYCNYGWYDTEKELSQFSKKAKLESKDQVLKADSLYYDRNKGYGQSFKNISLTDTTKDIIIKGDYAEFFRKKDSTMVTGNALLIQLMEDDSLFLHADTLMAMYDSSKNGRVLFAYHHVKVYKTDLQAACDSLVYSFYDSTMKFYTEPVIWSEENQLTADFITLNLTSNSIDSLNLYDNAFITSEVDSQNFNQVKGKQMVGYFKDNAINRMFVYGNGQSIYYALEDEESNNILGINKADCTNMILRFKKNKAQQITFLTEPAATLYPVEKFPKEELFLKGYNWQDHRRPKSKNDIFIKSEVLKSSSSQN